MDAIQELQLNRIARMQNLQKGENTFGFGVMQEDIEKAHEVGEIKVGKDGIKRVWTQLANGKFDWRRVKRDKTSQQEPTKQESKTEDKSGEKHKHEYKIEDAEKYVDNSNTSSVEKKVAKLILSGKSEKGVKQMMLLSKVNSSVVEHVYKLGEKLASEAVDEAKRIYKQENNWKSYGGVHTIEYAKKLAREWWISIAEAKEAFNKFEQEFGGPVEWSKNEKYVFTQPDSGTKYKFDPEEESWEKIEEKKSEQTEEAFSKEDVKKLQDAGYKKMSQKDLVANQPDNEKWVDAYIKKEMSNDKLYSYTLIIAKLENGKYASNTIVKKKNEKESKRYGLKFSKLGKIY